MKHNIELTTIELMLLRDSLEAIRFNHHLSQKVKADIINKIDYVVHRDIGAKRKENDEYK